MTRTPFIAFILIGGLAVTAFAYAQNGMGQLANRVDKAQKNFDNADTDRDGMLSKDEAEKGPVPFIRAHYDAMDANHDGKVTKQEVGDYIRAQQRSRNQAPQPVQDAKPADGDTTGQAPASANSPAPVSPSSSH